MLYIYIMQKNNTNSCTPTCLAHTRGSHPSYKSIDVVIRHAELSEKSIEKYLVEQAKFAGCPCLKYFNPNMVGYPDRLVVLPGGKVVWVELKSKGRKPSKVQQVRMAELTDLGHVVKVIDNKLDVDKLINEIKL